MGGFLGMPESMFLDTGARVQSARRHLVLPGWQS